MPGVNCAIVSSGTSRRTKRIGILSCVQLKMINRKVGGKNGSPKLWKQGLLIKVFREKILNDTVHTCEKHFKTEDIESCKYTQILSRSSLSELFFQVF